MTLMGAFYIFLAGTGTRGGIVAPLYLGNVVPVRDEFGNPMQGSPDPLAAAGRCLVEIRTAADGIIRAPATNGLAHPYNPLLSTNSVGGIGLNVKNADAGLFCLVLPNRPAAGTKVFARVYDAPTAADAAFYVDSALAVVPTNGASLVLTFGGIQPLDAADDDGDGLNNSWERALGTYSRPAADYDADGMSDLQEMLAGTDPGDAQSLLELSGVWDETNAAGYDPQTRLLHIRWPAVPGKRYQLEAAAQLTTDPATGTEPVFLPLGEVLTAGAGDTSLEVWVDVPGETVKQLYRIRLAEPEAQ